MRGGCAGPHSDGFDDAADGRRRGFAHHHARLALRDPHRDSTVGGHSSKVFEAMGWGALDAVNTPVLEKQGNPLPRLRYSRRSPCSVSLSANLPATLGSANACYGRRDPQPAFPLIVIGASTGGPAALLQLLSSLPPTLPAAITIVQHVDKVFAPGLAAWLARESSRDVRAIAAGDRPEPGR